MKLFSKKNIGVKGIFELTLKNKEGEVVAVRKGENTITNAAFAVLSGLTGNVDSQTAFTYLAVGTGTTAAAAADTALEAEITDTGLARAAATVSRVTTTQTNDTLQLSETWTATGAKAVTELGAFNDASAGTMFGHQVFSAINTEADFELTLTYKFVFSAV